MSQEPLATIENPSAVQPPEQSVPRGTRFPQFFKKAITFLKNLSCFLVWSWFFCWILGINQSFGTAFTRLTAIVWAQKQSIRLGAEVAIVGLLLAVIMFRKWSAFKFVLSFIIRLLCFPFIVAYLMLYLAFKSTKYAWRAIRLFLRKPVRSGIRKATLFLTIFAATSALIIYEKDAWQWLAAWVVLLGLCLLFALRVAFRWTAKPVSFFEGFLHLCFTLIDPAVSHAVKVKEKIPDPQKDVELTENSLKVLVRILNWSESLIERTTDQRIMVKFFLMLFASVFLLTVLIFALLYDVINTVHPGAFPDGATWTFGDFIYASLLVITTSGNVGPTWSAAKVAISAEIVSGISLLSLLVLQFSVISIPEIAAKRTAILRDIKAKKTDILNRAEEYRNRVLGPTAAIDVVPEAQPPTS